MAVKPKLLFILPSYSSNNSTHFTHTLEFIRALSQKYNLALLIEFCDQKPVIKGVKNIYTISTQKSFLNFFERFFKIILLRARGYKLIYVHYSYFSSIVTSLVCRLSFGKSYYWNCEKFENYGQERKQSWKTFLHWKLTDDLPLTLSLKFCNYLVTGANELVASYSHLFKISAKKIIVIPNSINLARFKPQNKIGARKKLNLPLNKKIILFVHWLSPRKGADLLPAIISNTVKHCKNSQDLMFLVIGGGPLLKDLSDRNYPCEVKFYGAVANKEINNFFSSADIFIMPSRQEGFSRVILEAMALEIPFVSSYLGAIVHFGDDIYKKTSPIPGNAQDFSEKLIQLLENEKLQNKLITLGKRKVKEFTVQKMAQRFKKLIG